MKVTPLDLRQAQFKTKMRGYDPQEVAPFLADAANELEHALREIDRLRQDLVRSETAMVEHRDRETSLRNTLLTAQRLADSIKENAESEARHLLREAESRADLILQKAQARLTEVERDISEMKLRRRDVEGSLEASIASLTYALDFMRAQDQAERDEKLLLHRPKSLDLASVLAAGPVAVGPVAVGPVSIVGPVAVAPPLGPVAVPSQQATSSQVATPLRPVAEKVG